MPVGFKGFRKPEAISEEKLASDIERLGSKEEGVIYTGAAYKRRKASLRSRSLATLDSDAGKFVSLSEFLRRAARATGESEGFDPATVKGGLALHAGAKPAVYLYVERSGDEVVAAKDFPTASFPGREGFVAIKAGTPIGKVSKNGKVTLSL